MASLEKDEAWQQAEALLLQMHSDSWWHILNKGNDGKHLFFFRGKKSEQYYVMFEHAIFGGAIDQIIQGLQPQGFSSQIPLSMFPSFVSLESLFFWGEGVC